MHSFPGVAMLPERGQHVLVHVSGFGGVSFLPAESRRAAQIGLASEKLAPPVEHPVYRFFVTKAIARLGLPL